MGRIQFAFFNGVASLKHFRVEPKDKQKALAYYGDLSATYEETVNKGLILRFFRFRERNSILRLAMLNTNAKTLIDVGCGSGTWALAGKQAGLKTTAMDANAGMLARLASRVDETIVADIESWKPGAVYDRVICAGVLDFVLQPEVAFRNLCTAVAPGGRVVLLVPWAGFWGAYYRIEKSFIGIKVNLYTFAWLTTIAKDCGLSWAGSIRPLPSNMAIAFERGLAPVN